MSYIDLKSKVNELNQMVEAWGTVGGSVSESERDQALACVKEIYAELRFQFDPNEEIENIPEPEAEPEIEFEILLQEEDEEEEEVVEAEPEVEVEEEIEEVVEAEDDELMGMIELAAEPIDLMEEDVDVASVKKKELHKRILSLYDDSEEEVKEVVEPIEPQSEVVEIEAPLSSRGAILDKLSINDRLLIANDLYDGDVAALRGALARLDRERSFDGALLCIAQNFRWRGECDGAKLLATILKNHYTDK